MPEASGNSGPNGPGERVPSPGWCGRGVCRRDFRGAQRSSGMHGNEENLAAMPYEADSGLIRPKKIRPRYRAVAGPLVRLVRLMRVGEPHVCYTKINRILGKTK